METGGRGREIERQGGLEEEGPREQKAVETEAGGGRGEGSWGRGFDELQMRERGDAPGQHARAIQRREGKARGWEKRRILGGRHTP